MSAAEQIERLPIWPSRPSLRRVAAGRTNENYVVSCANRTYFARVGSDLPEHGILRRQEACAARFAADLGIAPEVCFADDGLMITEYVAGHSLTPATAASSECLVRIAKLLRCLHQASPPEGLIPFDPVRVCQRYLNQLDACLLGTAGRSQIETLLDRAPPLISNTLIHADPVPENFIETGERLWLVDWEFAGLGDPATDLAMVAMNCDLETPAVSALVEAHALCSPHTVMRLRPVVAAREALWSLVQLQIRGPEGDLLDYTDRCLTRIGLRQS